MIAAPGRLLLAGLLSVAGSIVVRADPGPPFPDSEPASMGESVGGVLVADFNGDGLRDILSTPDLGSRNAILHAGHGDGTFSLTRVPTLDVGASHWPSGFLSAVDLNRDGKMDIALAPGNTPFALGWMQVGLGNGDGTFQGLEPVRSDTGGAPVLGDFNGDGRVDAANFNGSRREISLLFGRGDGSFDPVLLLATSVAPTDLAAGDLNGDGRDDLVFTDYSPGGASTWLGRPDRKFDPGTRIGGAADVVDVADVDSDGDVDVITGYRQTRVVSVHWSNGTGSFTDADPVTLPAGPIAITTGDLGGSPGREIVVAGSDQYDGGSLFVLAAAVGAPVAITQIISSGGYRTDLRLADMNADGHPDLVSNNLATGEASLLLGRGDGTFSTQTDHVVGPQPVALAGGDFNGDGRIDLISANRGSTSISVLPGLPGGGFAPAATVPLGIPPDALAVADLDRDGDADIVVACSGSTSTTAIGRIAVLLGHGDGTFAPESVAENNVAARAVVVNDFDHDGWLDVMAVDAFRVLFLRGAGDGSLVPAATVYAASASFTSMAAADLDADGSLDLALTLMVPTPGVVVLRGDGTGAFTLVTQVAGGIGPIGVTVGDYDRDGDLDIATADALTGGPGGFNVGLMVFHGDGEGDFSVRSVAEGRFRKQNAIVTGDFNADGFDDFAVTQESGNLVVQVVDTDGIRLGPQYFSAGDVPSGMFAGDLDGDGRTDLAVTDRGLGRVRVLFNRGPRQDEDGDGTANGVDTCTDRDGDGWGDPGFPASTCPLDNCPAAANLMQADRDGDHFGDTCDPCPDDPLNDMDFDGLCADQDPCPFIGNPGGNDHDGDGHPDGCDNCRDTANPTQADANADGSGDACQPTVDIVEIQQTGGDTLVVPLRFRDPDGDSLAGRVEIWEAPRSIFGPNLLDGALVCSRGVQLGSTPGEGLLYVWAGSGAFFDLDSAFAREVGFPCQDGLADFWFAYGACNIPEQIYGTSVNIPFSPPGELPVICTRRYGERTGGYNMTVGAGQSGFSGVLEPFEATLTADLELSHPEPVGTGGLVVGRRYELKVLVSDGRTIPAEDLAEFTYHGEQAMTFATNNPPVAAISSLEMVQCAGPSGGVLTLDGSASSDEDSSPGTHDDIASFAWYEDHGTPAQALLGSGETLGVTLSLGAHAITLVVTDMAGETNTAATTVTVVDTTPPVLDCPVVLPAVECSGAGGAYATLAATAHDLCGGDVALANDRTANGGDASGPYPLGTTTVGFTATDARGNPATCATSVTVVDTQAPTLTLYTDPTTLWPPNHELVPVDVRWAAHDACGAGLGIELVTVESSEPDDAAGNEDGATTFDIQGAEPGTADTAVLLRAERLGEGPGRTYTLVYRAVDAGGNATQALALVTVPHDQGQGPEPVLMRLERTGTGSQARLYWPGVPDALGYDVIRGNLGAVRVESGTLNLGNVRVLARATTQPTATEPDGTAAGDGGTPSAGEGYFYLIQQVTARGAAGYGTETGPWPRVPGSCDGGCPGSPPTGTTTAGAGGGATGDGPMRRR